MKDRKKEAARLHQMLDEIIRAKHLLEDSGDRLDSPEGRQALSQSALGIFSDAAGLMSELINEYVSMVAFGEFPETDDPNIRFLAIDKLVQKLTYLEPVLGAPNWSWWVSNFLDELTLLRSGDEPRLLKPAERRQGQKNQPGRKALLRLQALQWLEYLNVSDTPPVVRDDLVGSAYGTLPDTIRKWQQACENVLGVHEVRWRLAAAKRRDWADADFIGIDGEGRTTLSDKGKTALQADADAYWECMRSEKAGEHNI